MSDLTIKTNKPIEQPITKETKPKKTLKARLKTFKQEVIDTNFRVIVYTNSTNGRKIYMPQKSILGSWTNLVDERDYVTYNEHTAIDVLKHTQDTKFPEKNIIKTINWPIQ